MKNCHIINGIEKCFKQKIILFRKKYFLKRVENPDFNFTLWYILVFGLQ